ncbi:MAG: UDP-N-acetylmuramyl-tripeptide synthetase [Patescibacteria group bacterium]|jgi:UDP-N-acetylmuramoyl-L-alanyl-D-glutamate--2,6-diaminopimelate ligase|nr:UDP-N-acetylmuramyl-tripeptide synthetase [Patescibacteria group bacterium]
MLDKIKKLIPKKLFKAISPVYHFILSFLAAIFYKFPSRKLIIVGITGTAGKTSSAYLMAKMLSSAGYKTGLTSTAIFSDGDREWLNDKKMTMPGRFFIQKLLARMAKNGCSYAIVETTSEGIKQFRHRFINYDIILFTGLYPEHIDSHGSFEKYKETKGRLFSHLKRGKNKYINEDHKVVTPKTQLKKLDLKRISKTIIVNGDDDHASYFLNFWSEAKYICSFADDFDSEELLSQVKSDHIPKDLTILRGSNIESNFSGTSFYIGDEKINLRLLGDFNAKNAINAYALGLSQSIEKEKIEEGLKSVHSLAGKLEMIDVGQNFKAIVDYSFEPKAMEKLYEVIGLIPHNKLIHLLGSTGGGRDKARRPILGELAAKAADIVIITNEDPYDDDPEEIIDEVAKGAVNGKKTLNENLFKITDRRQAIAKAISLANEDDLVLFTGKGAEQQICVANGEKIPWDEREVVKEEIVEKLGIDKKTNM